MIRVVKEKLENVVAGGVLRAIRSDLAPVNAASRDVVFAAGDAIEEHLMNTGPLPVGGAVITPGGDLPADFLIHVVVMSEDEPQTSMTVQRALKNGLRRAADWAIETLAIPPLGLSVGLIEPEESARALVEILFDHVDEGRPPLSLQIVVQSSYEIDLFKQLIGEMSRDRG